MILHLVLHTSGVVTGSANGNDTYFTGMAVDQWDVFYSAHTKGAHAYFSNSTPATDAWTSSGELKYKTFAAGVREYQNSSASGKQFLNYALAVAFEWEDWASETPALLQSYYRQVLPYRTSGVTKPLDGMLEPTFGRKFAALTSAVVDAQVMKACLAVLGGGHQSEIGHHNKVNGSQLYAAAWLAMNQELQFDVRSQHNRWYKYNGQRLVNPTVGNFSFKQHEFPVEFIPQFVWVAMLLDIAVPWMEDQAHADSVPPGLPARVKSMEKRGASLWNDAKSMIPVAHETLLAVKKAKKKIQSLMDPPRSINAATQRRTLRGKMSDTMSKATPGDSKCLEELITEAEQYVQRKDSTLDIDELLHLYGNATHDLGARSDNPHPKISPNTISQFQRLLSKLKLMQ